MPDRRHDDARDREDLRSFGGPGRESAHPAYPPYWMHDENMRQGFGGMQELERIENDDGARSREPRRDLQGRERGPFYGRGPRGYRRSDQRLLEEISDRLMAHPDVDASDIEVRVDKCVAVLSGTVENRYQKRIAEYVAEDVMGVDDVDHRLKVRHGFWASLTGQTSTDRELVRTPERDVAKPSSEAGRASAARNAAARRSTGR